ncbi:MAG: DUF4886 domain-containing protein [Clostridia bacterium]|nr:DUF4886 domain-containing protein [Clostridia bacterium]
MKVLSIGNSFSEDAQRWLHDISLCGDTKIDTANLMIGGCTLETHVCCIVNRKPDYILQGNGLERIGTTTANEVIEGERFDAVTVQQASGFSGRPQSYVPYLADLVSYVKRHQPKAKIYFHKTWSYETDSDHGAFASYGNDQKEMLRRISDCAETAEKLVNIPVIPVGDFIQYLRDNTDEFNYKNGGLSLCRDGFHLSYDYGRFAAAAVWYKEFTGQGVNTGQFLKDKPDFDEKLVKVITENLEEFWRKR